MYRLSSVSVLLVAALMPSDPVCWAQSSDLGGSYARLLARYDRNGNGLLEARERAAMLAPVEEDPEPISLAAVPLVCEGETTGGGSGGASSSAAGQDQFAEQLGVRNVRWRRQQAVGGQPADDGEAQQADADQLAGEAAHGYPLPSPTPAAPQRPSVQFRNAVQYRMQLNEQQAQARTQPFARAATFGPMLGRTKRYPRRSFTVTAHVGCACSAVDMLRMASY